MVNKILQLEIIKVGTIQLTNNPLHINLTIRLSPSCPQSTQAYSLPWTVLGLEDARRRRRTIQAWRGGEAGQGLNLLPGGDV